MAIRSGPLTSIRTAATYAANATWYSTTAFQMGRNANKICIYATVGTASAGDIEFYIQHSVDGTTYFDFCSSGESPEVFGPITVAGADTRSIVIPGLPPNEYIQIYFRCSAGAASATLGLVALSYLDEAGNVSADVSVGDIEVSTEIMDDWDATHDSAAPADGCNTMVEAETIGSLGTVSADGDATRVKSSRSGVLYNCLVGADGAQAVAKAEDAAHATGDLGIQALAVRTDTTPGALAGATGDYTPLQVDADGSLYVVGEDAHDAVIAGNPVCAGAEAETLAALSTVNADGDMTRLKASTSGVLHVGLTDPTGAADVGTAIKTAVEIMDDWDESDRAKVNPIAGQAGIAANAGAMDALTTRVTVATDDTHFGAVGAASDVDGVVHGQLRFIGEEIDSVVGTDGAAGPAATVSIGGTQATGEIQEIQVDADGQLQVDVITLPGGLTGFAEDAAHQTGDVGVEALAVRKDTAATLTDADGDYQPLEVDANGRLHVVQSAVTAAAPLQTQIGDGTTQAAVTATLSALQVDLVGEGGASIGVTNPVFTELTDGTNAISAANPLDVQLTDGTTAVTVIAATAALKTDTSSIAGTACVADRGQSSAGVQRVVEAQDVVVTNATGAGAIATTTAISAVYQLESVTCKFSAAPTTSENFTITLDANDGADYDAVLYSINPSVTAATSIVYLPDSPIVFESGDEIAVAFTNTDARTYGLRIVVRKI